MGPPSYMRSVADRNVVMRHITVFQLWDAAWKAHCFLMIRPLVLLVSVASKRRRSNGENKVPLDT